MKLKISEDRKQALIKALKEEIENLSKSHNHYDSSESELIIDYLENGFTRPYDDAELEIIEPFIDDIETIASDYNC